MVNSVGTVLSCDSAHLGSIRTMGSFSGAISVMAIFRSIFPPYAWKRWFRDVAEIDVVGRYTLKRYQAEYN